MNVGIKLLHPDAKIPIYADPGASGFDFYAIEDRMINPGCYAAFNTGVAFDIPHNYEIQIRGRSGLAFKRGVVAAHFGTVDESYKGEVRLLLFNLGDAPIKITKGDRIAQGILSPVSKAEFTVVDELTPSERGANGFGSTGN